MGNALERLESGYRESFSVDMASSPKFEHFPHGLCRPATFKASHRAVGGYLEPQMRNPSSAIDPMAAAFSPAGIASAVDRDNRTSR